MSFCMCLDCDSLQHLAYNGSCAKCGSHSVLRRNTLHEIDEPLPKPLFDLYINDKAVGNIKEVIRELSRWRNDGGR